MKKKYKIAHMKVAQVYANLSHCNRRKVGCVIVKHDNIIAIGYNGTPTGTDNCCEGSDGTTISTVIHAEDNALRKLTRSAESAKGTTLFVTTAPCLACAIRIVDAKVKSVYYIEIYRTDAGLKYLADSGIKTYKISV
jgi:dCMP deaminase